MCIGERAVVIAAGDRARRRERVLARLRASDREIIEIAMTRSQLSPATCSSSAPGTRRWGLARAGDVGHGATRAQPRTVRATLRLHGHRARGSGSHHRKTRGGSVRCMLAEVFRPA